MWSFLNIRNSHPEVSSKKGVLKIKILQNSSKNICDAVFNLIKFQAKDKQLYSKETSGYKYFLWKINRMLLQKVLLKIKIAALGKF